MIFFRIYLYLIIVCFIFLSSTLEAATRQHPSQLSYACYLSNKFPMQVQRKQNIFDAFDKIYLYVKFSDIHPGKYWINVNWLKHSGEVECSNFSEIKIDFTSEYTYYSWFKLLKKGMFSRMFTGEEYDFDQKGQREVVVDVNGKKICSVLFEIK